MNRVQLIIGAIVAAMLIVAYVVVTVTNHDGTALLGILLGWLGGLGLAPAAKAATSSDKGA